MNEFNQILKKRAALIKKSLIEPPNLTIEKERKPNQKLSLNLNNISEKFQVDIQSFSEIVAKVDA